MPDICCPPLSWFQVHRPIGRTSRTWSSHDRGVNRDDPEGWKMPWKCLRKMEVGGPIPTTENSLSKNITKQDYLAGFIPAPRSFGAHGIFTFEVWYGSGMFKIWVVWKIWKGIPKSHVSRLPWTLPFWGIPLFSDFRQTRIFTARCSSLGNFTLQDEPIFFEPHIGSEARFLGYHVRNAPETDWSHFLFLFWDRMDFCPFTSKKHSSNIRQLCGHTQFVHCSAIAKPGLVRRPDGTSPNCVCRLLLGPYCRSLSFLAASSSIILSKQRHHLGPWMLQSLFCCQSESVWT